MNCDLLVVGASFAGLACARAAALAGLRVTVLEKKQAAGDKLHTTGIIVKDAVDNTAWLRDVPPALVRHVEGVRLYAPNMRSVDLRAPGYYFWATDAPALLDWMVAQVRGLGVDVRLGTLFESAQRQDGGWAVPLASGEAIRARYLVGADGPNSRVARALELSRNTQFLFGVEHEYQGARIEPGYLHCFIDRKLAPGYIGWALDGVGVAQVGLARRLPASQKAPGSRQVKLDPLLHKISGVFDAQGQAPVSIRAGMIPCGGVLPKVACERALLVGDAAGMVSPVTAGGIHTALRHGEQAGQGVASFLAGKSQDPAEWLVRGYPQFRTKRALRWCFDHFQSDWLFNRLLGTAPMRRAAELVYFHRKGGVALPDVKAGGDRR
ncbi:MAG: NAD(P)/FAD-dependent oxidoreductase [Comamonadaceae bacterium]|nr:MAG: NAD(P)/FAD-dependent oxidoreductase [Comamonadaceae bacterium]